MFGHQDHEYQKGSCGCGWSGCVVCYRVCPLCGHKLGSGSWPTIQFGSPLNPQDWKRSNFTQSTEGPIKKMPRTRWYT